MAYPKSEIDGFGNNGTLEPHQLDTTGHKTDFGMATDEKRSYAVGLGDVVVDRARDATLVEHSLTVREAFRLYRPAIGWSFLFSLGVIMAGFDVSSYQSRTWTERDNADWKLLAPTCWNSHRHSHFPERFWYSIRRLLSRSSQVAIRIQSRRACGAGGGLFRGWDPSRTYW